MNTKIKAIGIIGLIALGLYVVPWAMAQQANDYRAFVYGYSHVLATGDGNNATMGFRVAYVPVYPSVTYTFTNTALDPVTVDFSQPTKINDQIAQAVKQYGTSHGWNVIRVFVPSYDQKIP